MADNNTPSRAANMEKAEGDRSTAEKNINESESGSGARYRDENEDNAGGITNRPLDEEIDNQADLPHRGQSKDEITRGSTMTDKPGRGHKSIRPDGGTCSPTRDLATTTTVGRRTFGPTTRRGVTNSPWRRMKA